MGLTGGVIQGMSRGVEELAMTETPPEDDQAPLEEPRDLFGEVEIAISTDYKVLGRKQAIDGTGVLGHNTASTGTSFGVEGVTDSADTGAAGVRGFSKSGPTYGVFGETDSADPNEAAAIRARSDHGAPGVSVATSGNGQGITVTSDATGVWVEAETRDGAEFTTFNGNQDGVRGIVNPTFTGGSNPDGFGNGVHGKIVHRGSSSSGVFGESGSSSGLTYGVRGRTNSVADRAAGVIGEADGNTGKIFGLRGESRSSTDGAAGVGGVTWSNHGATFGVKGETSSTDTGTAGVYGNATKGSGTTYGVRGGTASVDDGAAGVYGESARATGTTFGVKGGTAGIEIGSAGVLGQATEGSGQTYGVHGSTASKDSGASGVFGEAIDGAADQTYGMLARTHSHDDLAAGLKAEALNGDADALRAEVTNVGGNAIHGTANGAQSRGVVGTATHNNGLNFGVVGNTHSTVDDASGVRGQAKGSTGAVHGVTGETSSSGDGAAGLHGEALAGSGVIYGVHGIADAGSTNKSNKWEGPAGVLGEGTGFVTTGVVGIGRNDGIGVMGITNGTVGQGFSKAVVARARASSGNTYGVDASVQSPDGIAVDASAGSSLGTPRAIDASVSAPDGYAIHASGQLHVERSVHETGATNLRRHAASIANRSSTDGADVLGLETPAISDPGSGTNFISFIDQNSQIGQIDGNGSGGVNYKSATADIAEYFPQADPEQTFSGGEVVGLSAGEVIPDPTAADNALVVSDAPMVTGNAPLKDDDDDMVCLALLGQVPIEVAAPVDAGDRLAATPDGNAISASNAPETAPLVGRALSSATESGQQVEALVPSVTHQQRTIEGLENDIEALRSENEQLREGLETLRDRVIDPVDAQEVLAGVEDLDVSTWEYKADEGDGQGVRHIGPMAGDFHEAFDVGASDTGINSIIADGVAFAAIKGLSQQLAHKDERIEELEAANEQVLERLAALEDQVAGLAGDSGASPAPADD